jgi:hypothetical protein
LCRVRRLAADVLQWLVEAMHCPLQTKDGGALCNARQQSPLALAASEGHGAVSPRPPYPSNARCSAGRRRAAHRALHGPRGALHVVFPTAKARGSHRFTRRVVGVLYRAMLHCGAAPDAVRQHVALRCNTSRCVATCCSQIIRWLVASKGSGVNEITFIGDAWRAVHALCIASRQGEQLPAGAAVRPTGLRWAHSRAVCCMANAMSACCVVRHVA